jgi:hypothetical protein
MKDDDDRGGFKDANFSYPFMEKAKNKLHVSFEKNDEQERIKKSRRRYFFSLNFVRLCRNLSQKFSFR